MSTRRQFIEHSALAFLGMSSISSFAQFSIGNTQAFFEKVSPESVGVDSQALVNFLRAADTSGLEWHSIAFLRHGKLFAEAYWSPFKQDAKHTLYSLSKSFTSTAIGLAVAEGHFSVEDPVIGFFPKDLPSEMSPFLKELKVKHLLTMNVGHEKEVNLRAATDKTWVQAFLAHPIVNKPGTKFLYNTPATYMLGAILYQTTGKTLEEYLKPRLFDKLGIKNYDWEKSPQGLNTAGYGLRISTRDIAKFGQLYIQKGVWEGKRILSESWIGQATRRLVDSQEGDSDWSQGYGYQFWRCKPEPGFFRGDGAYGQYCIMIPQYDMVLAVNSESFNMGKSMQIIWDHVLPGVKDKPLAFNKAANDELNKLSKSLQIAPPKAQKSSSLLSKINNKTIQLQENEFGIKSFKINIVGTSGSLSLDGKNQMKFGMESWQTNAADLKNAFPLAGRIHVPSQMAASATWLDDNTLQINRKFIESVHGDWLTLKFSDQSVSLHFQNSVAANSNGATDPRKEIQGKII